MTKTRPKTKKEFKEAQERVERAVINRNKFHNLTQLKPGQARWMYERALRLSREFDDLAGTDTWATFWTRDNVVKAIERGDVGDVTYWLRVKIHNIQTGLEKYAQY